ncbi:hypothetical protein PF005_g19959 [Phytophthora fragariae]|uniref:Sulfatase N-terminal domain-containing protein n=2 Tax=Phytophthora fragariae TaxID=53985 RepID=A0A6A3WPJ4_9STRA|nr:hypothetical protein PF005_g19959 [Phytophthora fragariae]
MTAKVTPVWQRVVSSSVVQRVANADLWTRPWLGWAFVYTFPLFVFFIYRCKSLGALFEMYASSKDGTLGLTLGALSLGFLQDFVCVTYFACALWLFDTMKAVASKSTSLQALWKCSALVRCSCVTAPMAGHIATFTASWLLFLAMMAPFVADVLIVQVRGMRFTSDLIAMAIEEKDHVSAAPISSDEVNKGYANAAVLIIVAKLFAIVRTKASWADLTLWNPTLALSNLILTQVAKTTNPRNTTSTKSAKVTDRKLVKSSSYVDINLNDDDVETGEAGHVDANEDKEALLPAMETESTDPKLMHKRVGVQLAVVVSALVMLPAVVVAISRVSSPLVAYAAMNASLNELFARALEPSLDDSALLFKDSWVELYIHNTTETHSLFGPDTLYRRTTGFKGELAFDVKVTSDNPPNVLLIAVESFQFHDSRYLVGENDPSNLFKGTNLTVTPNFDRWAERGVALRNFWSSVRTSRSVESLLFAQVPYDSPVHTGMAGGKRDTHLEGLSQLFTAKGYETFFTTGCTTHYDSWDIFLPTHGFDTVWSNREMAKLAESDLGVKHEDWYGPEARGLHWGVHDDVSFQILGDLLLNKTSKQKERMAQGKPKEPLFLTHYTISSHGPYRERPKWYAEAEKPDFSALYESAHDPKLIRDYYEMRYFTDIELGKFMDRMNDSGILNDTIVVIVGDHGTLRGVSTTRVAGAIIAEGRLGDKAGLVIDDATEHYDILNTLADITGVPDGGFVQDGIGRSLKRNVSFGERVVFSNDPNKKMAVVRGHHRLRYDRIGDAVFLHNADTDHHETTDLFPDLTEEEQAEWMVWRDNGRRINTYYTNRWDNKCLFAVNCSLEATH